MATNLLSLTGFKLKFNTDLFPLTEKLAVAATFPGISVSEVAINLPTKPVLLAADSCSMAN